MEVVVQACGPGFSGLEQGPQHEVVGRGINHQGQRQGSQLAVQFGHGWRMLAVKFQHLVFQIDAANFGDGQKTLSDVVQALRRAFFVRNAFLVEDTRQVGCQPFIHGRLRARRRHKSATQKEDATLLLQVAG